ncbi:MAG: lipoprotein-anchoring transpeptidase ErfK/SrfK [Paracoccaceae bacterium]|jgi:lipoprotein-anchoring transpeptidase ErfK/SrfK
MTPSHSNLKPLERELLIEVSISNQSLTVTQGGHSIFQAPVSTAANGSGFEEGSYRTPTGDFIVREKIGEGAPIFTSFKGRLPRSVWQGEKSNDAILSRILWLEGLNDENANTYCRYIYFHGTHAEDLIGQPASHGCIRLKNDDILTLFEIIPIFTPVRIL